MQCNLVIGEKSAGSVNGLLYGRQRLHCERKKQSARTITTRKYSDRWRFGVAVSSGISERLQTGKSPRYVSSHPGQLSLLPSAGREMSAGQSSVMFCGWTAMGMAHYTCECMFGWHVKLCIDPSCTGAILESFTGKFSQYKALYKCAVFLLQTSTKRERPVNLVNFIFESKRFSWTGLLHSNIYGDNTVAPPIYCQLSALDSRGFATLLFKFLLCYPKTDCQKLTDCFSSRGVAIPTIDQ